MPGEILKKRREDLSQDLKDIAHILKIRYDYLKAIEDYTFNKLPSEIYAKGYIREYAKFLKLDPAPLVKLYLEKTTPIIPARNASPPRRTSNMKYILIPVALCLGLIVFFSVTSTEKTKKTLAKNTSQTAAKKSQNNGTKNITNTNEQKTSTEKNFASAKNTKKEYDLQILVLDTTWLSINIDDTNKKEMLLKQGERLRFHANQTFSLRIGNAGGVTLVLDGKNLGSPGAKDEVISLNLPQDNLSAFNIY
ncbi:MAG: DUF4115 domain-containing protein [Nitrospiraceae bacterium]|nr:DUF4115 domain-containing protein [Nitrospiraceae bacterium]